MGAAERLSLREMTYEEFCRYQDEAEEKVECWGGELVAMAGGTPEHAKASGNIEGEVREARKAGSPCQPFGSDLRVLIPSTGKGVFPDVSVVCGEPEYDYWPSGRKRSLLNPTLVVEVLSDSTVGRDLGVKIDGYLSVPSIRQYVVVRQDEPSVRVFTRTESGFSVGPSVEGLKAVVRLESIGLDLPMAEIYRDVDLSGTAEPPND